MGKLHQLLAVEADLKNRAKVITDETLTDFNKKQHLFMGSVRRYEPFDSSDTTQYPEDNVALTTTVPDRIDYTLKPLGAYWDALLQKEMTNQIAAAPIVIDGRELTPALPATFLLGLETRLEGLRNLLAHAPTLPAGHDWEIAPQQGANVWQLTHPERNFKTSKTFQHKVLYEATEPHPAQIEKWEETVNVGMYQKDIWSGMLTSARKAALLFRTDALLRAVKKARQKANDVNVVEERVSQQLFDYILDVD